jgi:hypothetical protein
MVVLHALLFFLQILALLAPVQQIFSVDEQRSVQAPEDPWEERSVVGREWSMDHLEAAWQTRLQQRIVPDSGGHC